MQLKTYQFSVNLLILSHYLDLIMMTIASLETTITIITKVLVNLCYHLGTVMPEENGAWQPSHHRCGAELPGNEYCMQSWYFQYLDSFCIYDIQDK